MAEMQRIQKGARSRGTATSRKHSATHTYSRLRTGGRREMREPPQREKRGLWRLMVSAVIIVVAIACNLLAPDALSQIRGQLLDLMGAEGDFKAAFSAVGRSLDGESGIRDALSDACVAVFGAAEVQESSKETEGGGQADQSLYTQTNIPADALLEQRILGFGYRSPINGRISDGFGVRTHPVTGASDFHYGLDIEANEGTVIAAFADGKVAAVGESSLLGKYVTVQHTNGYQTLYAHCSRVTASSGQQVRMGDPIAEVGQTGQATGPHLHFELLKDSLYLNPVYYVAQ